MAAEAGLRARKKAQTRRLLAESARRLFTERGFENVSIGEIARVADVSPATVFNYFPTKEDLVYSGLETFEEQLLQAIRDRPSGETILEAFGRFVLEPRGLFAAPDEKTANELVALTRMIAESPALLAREEQIFARYTETLRRVIADETKAASGDLRPAIAAHALIGVHRTLIGYVRDRLEAGSLDRRRLGRDVRVRGDVALALLADGLGDYARKA
jgi:AcrR family transcriptional regulator